MRKMLRAVISDAGYRNAFICIRLMNDKQISRLNSRYLKHERSTDVISFDLSERKGPRVIDIAVNLQRAIRQASKLGHSVDAELTLYVLHGVLHCLGYNDLKMSDAARMHNKEDQILKQYGYGAIFSCK